MFRRLDSQAVSHEGQPGLVLSDPLGISPDGIFIPEPLLPLLELFDGQHSLLDITSKLRSENQIELPADLLPGLVRQLDQQLMLNSRRFREALERTCAAFSSLETRASSHAGSAGYPREAAECRAMLQKMLPSRANKGPSPRGLVAPHIDLSRGHSAYAEAYGRLMTAETADLYVIFGTGHQGPAATVTGLAMDWETPLGKLSCDRDFVARIHASLGPADPLDLLLHKQEHSIEFQVLFLQHLLGDREARVACFLTGALPSGDGNPENEAYFQAILTTFREAVAASGKRTCFIAGADLAHLGPFFGDPNPVDQQLLQELEVRERSRLAHLERGESGEFFRSVEAAGNPDRVCGSVPMLLTASLAEGPAELLQYGQAPAPDGSQIVSYAAMVFG